jgi:tetratricopeptide (TPR) repeat protein
MSSPVTKGMRRAGSRRAPKAANKSRTLKPKSARPKSLAKRVTGKAPAKKAQKLTTRPSGKAKAAKKPVSTPRKAVKVKAKSAKKVAPRKAAVVSRTKRVAATTQRVKKTHAPARAVRAPRPSASQIPPPRQPTVDETAALHTFDRAHREFTRGRFQEARNQFRLLLDRYAQVSEVAARARTYLAISESKLRTESMLPRDADSLYDRGVIELNRGEYVAAQEMFERALKREPEAAHIHYGLAATRGAIDLAIQSLQRALDLQPTLRVRAQHDQDLTPLRNDPDFDKLIFASRM